jgi:hypothetical protein
VSTPGQRTVAFLGPQYVLADVGRVLGVLGIRDRVALVTAGWQERESDDAALTAGFGVPSVNLRLHARAEEVFSSDADLTAAYQKRQETLRHLQDFYRLRLDYDDEAAHAISVRQVEAELLAQEARVTLEGFRRMDQDHLERCSAIHRQFETAWKLAERPSIAKHRAQIRADLDSASALVIAGGHVASLLNRLKLFDVLGLSDGKPIIAWSAGAMVLTERIVLFHDSPPYGRTIAQVLDAGLDLVSGVVILPDPQRRIRTDDRAGIGRFAQRMSPLDCYAFDHGAEAIFESGKLVRATVDHLTTDGEYKRKRVS